MSAQPIESPQRGPIPRDAKAVFATLPPGTADEFQQAFDAVLDEAKRTHDIEGLKVKLDAVVGRYWAVASALRSPNAADVTAAARRWGAGDDSDSVPAAVVFGTLR